jgi:hypothetical protein
MTTTSGVTMTTTRQFVSPWMESHSESTTSDTVRAPVMNAPTRRPLVTGVGRYYPFIGLRGRRIAAYALEVCSEADLFPRGQRRIVHCMSRPGVRLVLILWCCAAP